MSRSEQLDRKASYGNIGMVSEANSNTIGGIQDGRTKHITYAMEMPVPYSIHPKISEEGNIRESESRYQGDTADTMPVQEGRDHRRGGMCGSYTSMLKYTAEAGNIRIHGILEREVSTHDL